MVGVPRNAVAIRVVEYGLLCHFAKSLKSGVRRTLPRHGFAGAQISGQRGADRGSSGTGARRSSIGIDRWMKRLTGKIARRGHRSLQI